MSLPVHIEMRDFQVRLGGALVLDVPRLDIRRGEVLVLLGPNGAGKSTLIHSLALLRRPSTGQLRIDGRRMGKQLTRERRRISVVFQEPHLLRGTVYDNVAVGLRFRRVERSEMAKRVERVLGRLGIVHLQERWAKKLSGGEAARVSLARALVLEPEILMLDEPFSALDPPTRQSLLEDVQEAIQESGTTTVMSTHDFSEAMRLADRIAVIRHGRILQHGPPMEVARQPVDAFVARFVGVQNVLEAVIVTGQDGVPVARAGDLSIPVGARRDPGSKVLLCIRPEDVEVETDAGARGETRGVVERVQRLGHLTFLDLDCGLTLRACMAGGGRRAPEVGSPVGIRIRPGDVHILDGGEDGAQPSGQRQTPPPPAS